MKYAIYARVSPRGSDFEGETSIAMQLEICRQYVKTHGGDIACEKSDEFYSGKDTNRPGFSEIMADLESGNAEWDTLLVYKLSRMTRSLRDGADIFEKLFRQGRGFVSATENLDFSSPTGRAMLGMMQVFNQFEREQTAENTRNKMMQIASHGEWPAGLPPFGYKRGKKGDNGLYIDERKSAIVRDIFEMYSSDTDRTRKILSKYKGIVSSSMLFIILRNRNYLGELWYNGKSFPGKHEPIISKKLFDQVQCTLPQKVYNTRPKAQQYTYLLAGLLYCSCGKRMNSLSAKGGDYHYYTCPSCKKRIRAEKVDKKLEQYLDEYKPDKKYIEEAKKRLEEEQRSDNLKRFPELEQLAKALSESESEQNRIVDVILNSETKPSAALMTKLNEKSQSLDKEIQRLNCQIQKTKDEISLGRDYFSIANEMLDKFQKMKGLCEMPNIVARQAILSNICAVEITKDNKFRVIPSSTNGREWLPRRDLNPN